VEYIQERFDKKIRDHLYHYYWECLGVFDWENCVESRKIEILRAKAILQAIEKISVFKLN